MDRLKQTFSAGPKGESSREKARKHPNLSRQADLNENKKPGWELISRGITRERSQDLGPRSFGRKKL